MHRVALLLLLSLISASAAAQTEDEFLQLYDQFWRAEPGSKGRAQTAAQLREALAAEHAPFDLAGLHAAYTRKQLGEETIQVFRNYMAAPSDSAEETEYEQDLDQRLAASDIPVEEAQKLLFVNKLFEDGEEVPLLEAAATLESQGPTVAEVGGDQPLHAPPVELELIPPKTPVTAGEIWSLFGIVRNESDAPVWIVDKYSTVALSPSLYGAQSDVGSIGAFFPTIESKLSRKHDLMRLDPGSSYTILWKIDPIQFAGAESGDSADGVGFLHLLQRNISHLVVRVINAWSEYVFFVPGEYSVAATIHVWPTAPVRDGEFITNLGDSVTESEVLLVDVSPSPWVLIFGAWIGGALAFSLQALTALRRRSDRSWRRIAGEGMLGLTTALLLTGVVTILLSRMSSSTFIVSIAVQDIWGAVTIGFVVQWIGFPYLRRLLPGSPNPPGPAPAASGGEPAEPQPAG